MVIVLAEVSVAAIIETSSKDFSVGGKSEHFPPLDSETAVKVSTPKRRNRIFLQGKGPAISLISAQDIRTGKTIRSYQNVEHTSFTEDNITLAKWTNCFQIHEFFDLQLLKQLPLAQITTTYLHQARRAFQYCLLQDRLASPTPPSLAVWTRVADLFLPDSKFSLPNTALFTTRL